MNNIQPSCIISGSRCLFRQLTSAASCADLRVTVEVSATHAPRMRFGICGAECCERRRSDDAQHRVGCPAQPSTGLRPADHEDGELGRRARVPSEREGQSHVHSEGGVRCGAAWTENMRDARLCHPSYATACKSRAGEEVV